MTTFWLTGLSGSGKSTLSTALADRLRAGGQCVVVLDGDAVRAGLSADLDFSAAGRRENIRRVAEVARLLNANGVVVLAALISPLEADRLLAREVIGHRDFVEVFVDAPLALCEQRDPKGLYRRARSGALAQFTGISSPYEVPVAPDVHIRTGEQLLEDCLALLETVYRRRITEGPGHERPAHAGGPISG